MCHILTADERLVILFAIKIMASVIVFSLLAYQETKCLLATVMLPVPILYVGAVWIVLNSKSASIMPIRLHTISRLKAPPPPAPVTPELTLSASSVSLKVGQAATIQAATKSSDTIYLDFQTTDGRPFSIQRGKWNSTGTRQPITITGKYAGTTDLTVVMRKADTGAALASKTVSITVAPSKTPKVTFSPASAVMEVGSAVDVTADIAWNGASYLEWGASRVLCSGSIEKQSNTRSVLHFRGETAGSATQYARLLDANRKELAVCQLPVTVTPRTPASVRANPTSVEVEAGKQASIPIA